LRLEEVPMSRYASLFVLVFLGTVAVTDPGVAKDIVVPDQVPTLDEAIAQVEAGDRILLRPGEYEAAVRRSVPFGFSLIGEGGNENTVVRGKFEGGEALTLRTAGEPLVIRGIRFDRSDTKTTFAAAFVSCDLLIEDCVFVAGAGGILIDSCSGTVRANLFSKNQDAIRLIRSPILVEENEFNGSLQYGVITRGSRARIERNRFIGCVNACIVAVGKRDVPVIGGAPGKGNVFRRNIHMLVINKSRNLLNAQYNDWGPIATSTMEELGYPANLEEFRDGWDQEYPREGRVDYQNWITASAEGATTGEGGAASSEGGGSWTSTAIPVLVVLFVVLWIALRRKKRS